MVQKSALVSWVLFLIMIVFSLPAFSQFSSNTYFGKNKVQYKSFDWHFIDTEHFTIHFYPEEEQAAMDVAHMAEKAYKYLSETLDYELGGIVPLFLYASVNDFQQTNIIHGLVGQGTRGVTEGIRNRMALPLTGSYRELNHVLIHEMVHAFQFDIIKSRKSLFFSGGINVPLWFVEGMAEYLSVEMDNITLMWVRDAFIHDKMPSIQQLNGAYDIRVYRLGESIWHYIGENHGKEKVGELFKAAIKMGDLKKASEKVLDMDLDELTRAWHQYAGEYTFAISDSLSGNREFPQEPEHIAELLTKPGAPFSQMNIIPSASPDGENIIYLTNKSLKSEFVMVTDNGAGKSKTTTIVEGSKSAQFEALQFFDTAIGWSPDGQLITFVSKSGKDDVIYIMDPHTKKILRKFKFDDLNGIKSPAFSPDINAITFVGMSGGISDLYLLEFDDESLIKLTNDRYTALHPQWSPDGNMIAFVTDYGDDTDFKNYTFGDYDLAIYDLENNIVEMITDFKGTVTNPQWSPDSREIAFLSDHDGVANIYKIRLDDRTIVPITELQNGIAGITEATPAFSWSINGEKIIFSAFENAQWQLYKFDLRKTSMDEAFLNRE